MNKLVNILSELQIINEYISTEIDEIEDFLCNQISEHTRTHQINSTVIQQKIKQIEQLKKEEEALFVQIKDRENGFDVAQKLLSDLQSQYENLARFEKNYLDCSEQENVQYKKNLFGIDIESNYLEPTIYQAKILFAENQFVIFNCDIIRNTYDLIAIEPNLASFEEVRSLLLESGDILGFMCHVWKRLK